MLISVIDSCNLTCKMCNFFEHMTNKKMSMEQLINVLDQVENTRIFGRKTKSIRIDGNCECLLHKEIKEIVKEIKKRRFNCGIVTNGTLLSEEISYNLIEAGVDDIFVSVTGITPEVYWHFQGYGKDLEKVRRQLDTVALNVEKFSTINRYRFYKSAELTISYLLTELSLCDANRAALFWKSKGADNILYTTLNSGLGKNKQEDDKYLESATYTSCYTCFNTISIAADGDVYVCCNDSIRASSKIMGNVFETNLNQIVNSDKYNEFVNCLIKFDMDNLPECCQRCDLIKKSERSIGSLIIN